jgi:beta-galactosidase
MKTARILWLVSLTSLLSLSGFCAAITNGVQDFDANWSFLKSEAVGADVTGFNDSAWRKLNLPHDWSIKGPFAEHNKIGGAGAFLPSGVGWYRKHFSLPAAM